MNNWIDTSQIEWIVNVLCLQVDIPSEPEDDDDDDPDGRFAFKRKLGVEYLSVGILSLDAMDCLLFFFSKVSVLIVSNFFWFIFPQPRFDSPQPLPWVDPAEGGLGDRRFRFTCTSISSPQRVIGFARRRIGRGGR